MWLDEYKKKVSLMNTDNNNEYYIRLYSYLEFILTSTPDELKGICLMKIECRLNILNDPILKKIKEYNLTRLRLLSH